MARIKAWWVMVMVVGGAILAGRQAVIGLFAFVSLAAPTRVHHSDPNASARTTAALFLKLFCRFADAIRSDLG